MASRYLAPLSEKELQAIARKPASHTQSYSKVPMHQTRHKDSNGYKNKAYKDQKEALILSYFYRVRRPVNSRDLQRYLEDNDAHFGVVELGRACHELCRKGFLTKLDHKAGSLNLWELASE